MPPAVTLPALVLLFASLVCMGLVFCVYPLCLLVANLLLPSHHADTPAALAEPAPRISVITVARNAKRIVQDKLANFQSVDYPEDRLEMIVFSDGSTDGTEEVVRQFADDRVTALGSAEHRGKVHGMDRAVEHSSGDLLVFSDVNARFSPDALRRLARHFSNPRVGGVCGRRVIADTGGEARQAQAWYVDLDSTVKALENALGAITSNDGKIYAIRRELYRPINPGSADDLYCCLNVVEQGKRFLYEPQAQALIPTPSRTIARELSRRRRIVCGSMVSLFDHLALLNPVRHGLYGCRLAVNKFLRRMLPLALLGLLISSAVLTPAYPAFGVLLTLQVLFYVTAGSHWLVRGLLKDGLVARLLELPFYFCLGNAGTLLGLWDYVRGRRYVTWETES